MADNVSASKRSEIMSNVRSENTKPEVHIRKALFKKGYRYKIHDRTLPGKPDIVLPKYNCVIFYNGCFWHGHSCHLGTKPATRTEYWTSKIKKNRARDEKNIIELKKDGWRVLCIWSCAYRGKYSYKFSVLIDEISKWIDNGALHKSIVGFNK